MDVNTGHLVADINLLDELTRKRYTPVPENLIEEARAELDGRAECYVNPKRAEALATWAKNTRKKNRARAKLQKASRKRNQKS